MADYDELPYIVVERRSGSFGAFLLGALVGAGIALLYAPRSGSEIRRELRNGVQRMRETAEGAVRQVQETVASAVDDLREQVTDQVESARRAVEAGREAARRARTDLERRIHEAQTEWAAAETRRGGQAERAGEESPS